jgi:predicted nuclease with TOPRIM domain
MNNDVTLKEFEELIESAYTLKREKDELEAKAEEVGARLSGIQNQLITYMEEFDKTSYKSKHGLIVRAEKMSVKVPKDPSAKEAFFNYLAEKGIKDDILTVNSKTLNSFYNAEMEAARERGETDFSMPGVDPPSVYTVLQMRK